MFKKKNILEVGMTNAKEDEILEYILQGLEKKTKKYFIVTPNPEILMLAHKNLRYKRILNSAELALPDGIGVMIAGKILGRELKQKITGVNLVESLCKEVAEKPITVGFLGAGPGIAEQTAKCLKRKYPGLKVTFASSKFKAQGSESHNHEPIIKIPATDILFVAFGSPKQEIWISENLKKLPVKVAIGVGGAFDFISGKVRRAPYLMRKIGLEWLFRLIYQPWRAKRQVVLVQFIFLVLKERFKINNV